ncbi:uncharacterized protein LOC143019143 [Oratosquilla oratoria]|uniref:uncharacterized protein LOC143019143 n=1 Tax=Oratosquilla oratoria TaxID=337810 RepID=UPI003F75943B
MGSPLGVFFANFFMGTIEEKVLSEKKPSVYCRYIDDIFVMFNTADELEDPRQTLMEESGLTFTIENRINGSLPFLDVQDSHSDSGYKRSVYVKSTNNGRCLNGQKKAIRDEVELWYFGHNPHTDAPNKTSIKLFYKSHMA